MSVCVFGRKKKRQKKVLLQAKIQHFLKALRFLEVSVSSFADRHRVFDEKVSKTSKNN